MDIKEALNRIEEIRENFGEGLLETLMYMGENLDDFPEEDVRAYRIAMRDFRKLFMEAV